MTAQLPIDTLGATIKAHVAKGDASIEKAEQHYKAAGIHLAEAKERVKATRGLTWSAFVVQTCGIGVRRAADLIMIGDGRTTLEELRSRGREKERRTREDARAYRAQHASGSPEISQSNQQHEPEPPSERTILFTEILAELRRMDTAAMRRVAQFLRGELN